MRYLLDTNAVSELVRQPQGRVAARIAEAGESEVCTSIVVAAELRYGAEKRKSPKLTRQLEAVLGVLAVVPLEAPADERYCELRSELERQGRPIGGNDMLIAAQALALSLTVVTDNGREFSRVPGLIVENWLR
ncbi:MAG: type II toxin-antitoxin system VapC family toxin [Gemmatimonadota bacterium]